MGARTLEARLTGRMLLLAGAVLVGVGVAAVVVTDRVLDSADTSRALGAAAAGRDALERELDEGDPTQVAIEEVVSDSATEGVRLSVTRPPTGGGGGSSSTLPVLAPGACVTIADDRGVPWRTCAAEGGRVSVVAAIAIGGHRSAVGTLARGMVAVVAVALLALWLAVKRTVRGSLRELMAMVGWTARIVETEQPVAPPPARTLEVLRLEEAFDTLVRRLLEALARERANSAHIAHELRTPLTAIVAELESLKVHDEAGRAAVSRVRDDVARLADVIDAILVLSTRAAAPTKGHAVVNVADLARELAPRGVRVDAPDEALVEGDERLVALALRNLLDNARKYAGGADAVRVSRSGEGVRLAVLDHGPGLDEGARAKMFDRYWRGTADGEGRGLGLALVRAVAERHGGSAQAQPRADGKGLDVSLTLGGVVGWHEEPAPSR
jgi:signal transduction histidine kinase